MLIIICAHPRTGSKILCETIGQHSKITAFVEQEGWEREIKKLKHAVVKPTYAQAIALNIIKKYPHAKIIFLERNILGLAASMKRWEERGTDTRPMILFGGKNRKTTWFEIAETYKDYLEWKKEFEGRPNIITIKFEDLILKKMETFEKVFKFIGLDISADVRTYISTYVSDGPVKNYPGQASSAGYKSKVNNWKEVLTDNEIDKIKSL